MFTNRTISGTITMEVTTAGNGRSLRQHKSSNDGLHPQGEKEDGDMVHPLSHYKGGNRKYSFQLPEDCEEGRFPSIIQQNFESSFLRKRKVSSD